jgi:4-carboxymuconolactone decarboxylase
MSISETANKNHEEMFPNHKSTLKEKDPELIEVFDNFAFDEVLSYGTLDTRTRVMMILASTIESQALSEYKVMLVAGNSNISEIAYRLGFENPPSFPVSSKKKSG